MKLQRFIHLINKISYIRVAICLGGVYLFAKEYNATVHMPRIGAGLAGGDWAKIQVIIEQELCRKGVTVTVYELP